MQHATGIALMVLSMALFALADLIIKLASDTFAPGQVIFVLSLGGLTIFASIAVLQGHSLWNSAFWHRAVIARNIAEVFAAGAMITALGLIDLSVLGAILQASPLAVMAGAAVLLGERVGMRRWLAAGVGFVGVLVILRPGLSGFDPASLIGLAAMLGLSARDLTTRRVPEGLPTIVLASYGLLATLPLGAIWALSAEGRFLPVGADWPTMLGMVIFASGGYFAITLSVRLAPISVVAPFRYSRLLFLAALGIFVLGEQPDIWLWIGSSLIIGSGLYALARERRAKPHLHSSDNGA